MAKLKTSYATAEEIPEGYADLYAERGGKYELTGVDGIKSQADIDRMDAALKKERTEHKATKDKLGAFGELDPTAVHAQLEEAAENKTRIDSLTKDGKLDETKIQERIQAAVNTAVGPITREKTSLEKQLDAQKKATAEEQTKAAALEGSIKQSKIEGALRDAAIGEKVIASAIDDAVMNGVRVFELTEDNRIITRDSVGVTPGLSPKEWLKDMQEKRAHWWPASVGGGAGGARGGVGGQDNPWAAKNWNITAQGRYVREHGVEKATEMAKRVGSILGATKPPAESKAA